MAQDGFAVAGHSLIQSLTYGIVAGSITGLAAGLLTPLDFVAIENGNVTGILIEGLSGAASKWLWLGSLLSRRPSSPLVASSCGRTFRRGRIG